MKQAEEDLLVLAAQAGKSKALNYLCRHYYQPLLRFAYKICGDEHMSQDAVQEAWIQVNRNLNKLKDPRAFRSWLYQTVRWRCLDIIRSSETLSSLEDSEPESVEFDEGAAANVELSDLLQALPEIDKLAVHLFYLEELKISEIAIVLDIPSGTVKSRLNRARKNLKNKLEKDGGDES